MQCTIDLLNLPLPPALVCGTGGGGGGGEGKGGVKAMMNSKCPDF